MNSQRTAYVNARVVDPAQDHDAIGGLLVEDGRILDAGAGVSAEALSADVVAIDCQGMILIGRVVAC